MECFSNQTASFTLLLSSVLHLQLTSQRRQNHAIGTDFAITTIRVPATMHGTARLVTFSATLPRLAQARAPVGTRMEAAGVLEIGPVKPVTVVERKRAMDEALAIQMAPVHATAEHLVRFATSVVLFATKQHALATVSAIPTTAAHVTAAG
eukprot:ANDGO_07208.mRNA.1 hypothetical protein